MKRVVFSIVLLALHAHSCVAEIVMNNVGPRRFDRLYRAAVDIAMTCYGDPGDAVGVLGDTDGSMLKELRSNHMIPVVLVNGSTSQSEYGDTINQHKLKIFLFAAHSLKHLRGLIMELINTIFWNDYANFLIVDTSPEPSEQCSSVNTFLYTTTRLGALNAQVLCYQRHQKMESIVIWNSSPFSRQAPEVWTFMGEHDVKPIKIHFTMFLFTRKYREKGQSCDSINFKKIGNAHGHTLNIMTTRDRRLYQRHSNYTKEFQRLLPPVVRALLVNHIESDLWFVDNIVRATNVTAVFGRAHSALYPGIFLLSINLSDLPVAFAKGVDRVIFRQNQWPIYAVTQHTGHMSQLDKILSVVDGKSRVGVCFVYLITFLFFKLFLRQAAVPAVLNLVRLTCNTGLPTLPQSIAPTVYLTSLFMFVVTLQGIYTGNLATLLTTTIPYRNVQTKEDIAKLGYRLYVPKKSLVKLIADPSVEGRVVEIARGAKCIDYVKRDPLAVCAMAHAIAVTEAETQNLHVGRDPLIHEYKFYVSTMPNMFRRRVQEVMTTLFEAGLPRADPALEKLRLRYVDDDEVKRNTDRRIMTFGDLSFAFVILGVGLLCSLVCFVGEIVICWVRLICAKRRDRHRVKPACRAKAKRRSWFRSLNCRFNLRRAFRRQN